MRSLEAVKTWTSEASPKRLLLLEQASFDDFSRQGEGDKYRLALVYAFGLMGQACTAIDRFFNL